MLEFSPSGFRERHLHSYPYLLGVVPFVSLVVSEMGVQAGLVGSESPSGKPAILCLHGGGTSAKIFNIQTVRLQRALKDDFDFVFVDGPFQRSPGPGVLPVFEGFPEYLNWLEPSETSRIAPKETIDILKEVIEEQEESTGRGFSGVMGFSQGAKLAAGLLLHQQQCGDWNTSLRFAVLLNSVEPPIRLAPQLAYAIQPIQTPSVHVIGLKDPYVDGSRTMATEYFEKDSASVIELNIGHHLPTVNSQNEVIADEIRKVYQRTLGG